MRRLSLRGRLLAFEAGGSHGVVQVLLILGQVESAQQHLTNVCVIQRVHSRRAVVLVPALVHEPVHVIVPGLVSHFKLKVQHLTMINAKPALNAALPDDLVNGVESVLRQGRLFKLLKDDSLRRRVFTPGEVQVRSFVCASEFLRHF